MSNSRQDQPLRLAIFTICSNNYIVFAETLFKSAAQHHPDAILFLCLADRNPEIRRFHDPGWRIVEASTLKIPNFSNIAFRYDIKQLTTAIEPFMFRYLFDELEFDGVMYFDPDIEIFRPLKQVISLLQNGASIVLTPHLCSPSENLSAPNDFTEKQAVVYNLGFLGMRRCEESRTVIDRWAHWFRFPSTAQTTSSFAGQQFTDLIPGLASHVHVCRDVTLNVAYWNLHHRVLKRDEEGFTVDGKKLTFFHYAGFDPNKPEQLSGYETNVSEAMSPAIRALTAGYASRLIANGFGAVHSGVYAYGHFASGTAIHDLVREMFREWHKAWPDDPFETYEEFLHEPWPEASRKAPGRIVTNFMKFLHSRIPSLGQRLDLAVASDVRQLLDWFVMQAPQELHLDLKLIQPAAERMGLYQPHSLIPSANLNGAEVTVIGYLRTASGVGEVARQTLRTLAMGGIAVEGLDVALNVAAQRQDMSCEDLLRDRGTAPIQIFNINADQLGMVLDHVAPRARSDAFRINIPFWELGRFPSIWLNQLTQMDEIWAPSRFIQATIAGRLDKPVIYMPVAIEIERPLPISRFQFGLPDDRFLYFFAFDFMSFMARKNPHAVIAAFRRAFPRNGTAGLVLKCMNGSLVPDQFAEFRAGIDDHPDIFLIDATLSRPETLGLIAAVDAVVSLHRSEGLGLLIAEAMLLGKPVIATDYSATREFLSASTGYPVDYQLISVRPDEYPFAEGQTWAAADVSHAAWLMRRLYDDPTRAAPLVAEASRHLRRNHSRTHIAHVQTARLRWLGA